MPNNRFAVTVAAVVALTITAATTAIFATPEVAAVIISLTTTNILSILSYGKTNAVHGEVKELANGRMKNAVREAIREEGNSDGS